VELERDQSAFLSPVAAPKDLLYHPAPMPFVFRTLLDHGTTNPIVARLGLQVPQILDSCNITPEVRDKVAGLYVYSLQKKLLRCWEIKERFRHEFNAAIDAYHLDAGDGQSLHIPQIMRLEEECRGFLYEIKNYIRDLLEAVNLLYGTAFREASEFSRAKKGKQSLVEFAMKTFDEQSPKTIFLREAVVTVEYLIALRNAAEHPGGHSGTLRIENFALEPDGKISEPTWHREKDGQPVNDPSSIRADMETAIHNMLFLGEDIVASWAADNLHAPELMRIAQIPEDRRDPKCPIRYVVTVRQEIEDLLSSRRKRR
jgi:hypothetical protein